MRPIIAALPPRQEFRDQSCALPQLSAAIVRQGVPAPLAALMKQCHSLRLQYSAFADSNPIMDLVRVAADQVRENPKPVRQSVHCLAGCRIEADRQYTGQLAGHDPSGRRKHVPVGLWIAGAGGRSGILSGQRVSRMQGGEELAHRALLQERIFIDPQVPGSTRRSRMPARGLIYVPGMAWVGPTSEGWRH